MFFVCIDDHSYRDVRGNHFFLIWTDVQLFNSLYNFMSEKHFLGTDVTICTTVNPCAHEQTKCDVAKSSTTLVNLRV